jgi:hypothetical protein
VNFLFSKTHESENLAKSIISQDSFQIMGGNEASAILISSFHGIRIPLRKDV